MLRIERLGGLFGPVLLAMWPLGGLVNSQSKSMQIEYRRLQACNACKLQS